jgi:hypothetical protein
MKPVLNDLIEELGLFATASIVAAALFKDVGDLLVGAALTGADLANLREFSASVRDAI